MMTEEELDLFLENFKKELEEELSKPITVCPHCTRNHNSIDSIELLALAQPKN